MSKVNDPHLRGRVQILLSKLLPISHESGTNLKSQCDTTPIIFDKENMMKEKENEIGLNFNTYRKFWSIQKFLQNPLDLLNDEEGDDESNLILFKDDGAMEIEENIPNKKETIVEESLGKNNKKPDEKIMINTKSFRFSKFFEKVLSIIEIFNNNPIVTSFVDENVTKQNYPRYLSNSDLLEIQFKDPKFRKVWLTQVLLAIHSLKNPIKINPNKNYILLADQVIFFSFEVS